jgi:peroxiredoxin
MSVEVGQEAPDFELRNQFGQKVRLADYRGRKNVVVMFYPLAFTPTCTMELCALRDDEPDFVNDDVQVLSISCDSTASLRVFAEQEGLGHPLLSDFWPHGAVARAYGVFDESKGIARRGTFVVDKAGILRWSVVTGGEARSVDDYRSVLADLA